MMKRPFSSVICAALFFMGVEGALRVSAQNVADGDFSHDGPVVLLFGSSRTEFGLKPKVAEATLRDGGVENAWVANVTHRALTMVGMLRLYREKLHPMLDGGAFDGWIGIEIRGAGLNDSYRVFDEPEFLAGSGWDPEAGTFDAAAAQSPLDLLRTGHFDEGAGLLLGGLTLVERRDELRATLTPASWFEDRGVAEAAAGSWEAHLLARGVSWASGDKGWNVFQRQRRADLNVDVERRRFTKNHLKAYRVGGVQTACLRQIIAEARADGLKPFVYVMPVTAIHRGFYEPGDYAEFLRFARRIAEVEAVPFFDLDSNHGLPNERFHDTGHLHHTAATPFSKTLATKALLPLLTE